MSLKRIEHVQLAIPPGGEDAARRFYADALGMTEMPKPANLAKRGGCWFASGDVRVHLGVQTDFHPATKAHPAFVVDDLESLRARLNAAGFACKDDEPLTGFYRTYVSDPFGNRIELMEAMVTESP
ncbi:VOC family protein [Phyllobacterium leguminum]|uniref:Catechol 2,3-dioxygenase-like lactoylglutathione lyase family enzyme n=1 Tax=Phyllobacterium leguminum TaxID=314237 RepID=A0A318T3M9_9HYPH|nr:VOC family protein [Phyllobacterium leguminum]PYE88671.1 catechol 2,3-dioxygenase-like lactoylglutathione lyase family enzyme [Phyllobacterium leguminum]